MCDFASGGWGLRPEVAPRRTLHAARRPPHPERRSTCPAGGRTRIAHPATVIRTWPRACNLFASPRSNPQAATGLRPGPAHLSTPLPCGACELPDLYTECETKPGTELTTASPDRNGPTGAGRSMTARPGGAVPANHSRGHGKRPLLIYSASGGGSLMRGCDARTYRSLPGARAEGIARNGVTGAGVMGRGHAT